MLARGDCAAWRRGWRSAQAPAATPAPAARPAPPADAALAVSSAIEATASAAGAAVVEIFTMSYAPTEGRVAGTTDLVRTQRATGSGAIVDASGYIVTNAHVVRGAQRIRVEVPTVPTGGSILAARGRLLDGRIVGLDLETDLAVIKVEATGLPTLAFGDSDDLRAGQIVVALGSPLGFNNSVSLGVVSAVARQLEPESPMVYVQSDAAISSGSSGGPLVDLRGRIVGINTLVASREGAAGEGLGFAAPSNIVRAVYEQIRQHGRVRRGDIGVRPQTLTPMLATGARPGARPRRRPRRRAAGRAGGAGGPAARATSSSRWTASRWRTAASSRSACIAAPSATWSRSTSCARASRSRSA